MPGPAPLPVDFLLSASRTSLQDFELAHLNHAAALRKQLRIVLEKMIDEMVLASTARALIENEGLRSNGLHPNQECFDFMGGGFEDSAPLDGKAESRLRNRTAA